MSAHNALLPVYNPYLEADVASYMYQVHPDLKKNRKLQRNILSTLNKEVGEIMTTHGYAANIESIPPRTFNQILYDFLRCACYELPIILSIQRELTSWVNVLKGEKSLAEIQRRFWMEKIDGLWSEDMLIFKYVDREKLNRYFRMSPTKYHLKARILYIERLMREIDSK